MTGKRAETNRNETNGRECFPSGPAYFGHIEKSGCLFNRSTHHRNIPDKTRGKHIMKTLFAKSHRLSMGVDPLIHHENRVQTQKNSDKM
jgi:hypothetical protein